GSRFTINTGLPAVAGWDYHQTQQRGAFQELIDERHADVSAFYTTNDPVEAQDVLKKYDVHYVVLGTLERIYYPIDGLEKIEAGLGGMLQPVFQHGDTQIFEVVQGSALVSAD
ncbi:MAG: hypothetical protein Q8S13_10135, partial [Dehalococcoidia bacterium]|nr:hypothetical protein [Dehalococcoidia bacterium]